MVNYLWIVQYTQVTMYGTEQSCAIVYVNGGRMAARDLLLNKLEKLGQEPPTDVQIWAPKITIGEP